MATWEDIHRKINHIFRPEQHPEDIEEARVAYIDDLQAVVDRLIADAQEAIDSPKTLSTGNLRRITHHYRRLVAGHHQIRDLVQQGKDAVDAAIEDEVIIFEGQRWVFL